MADGDILLGYEKGRRDLLFLFLSGIGDGRDILSGQKSQLVSVAGLQAQAVRVLCADDRGWHKEGAGNVGVPGGIAHAYIVGSGFQQIRGVFFIIGRKLFQRYREGELLCFARSQKLCLFPGFQLLVRFFQPAQGAETYTCTTSFPA